LILPFHSPLAFISWLSICSFTLMVPSCIPSSPCPDGHASVPTLLLVFTFTQISPCSFYELVLYNNSVGRDQGQGVLRIEHAKSISMGTGAVSALVMAYFPCCMTYTVMSPSRWSMDEFMDR
jgi:hypothetical protein